MEPSKVNIFPLHKLRGSAYPLLNLLLFKLSWLLLVLGQQAGLPWALALQGLSLALHPALRAALLPALAVALAGLAIDKLCQVTGLFIFPQDRFPGWLVILWLTFAFALPQGLGFLRKLRLPVLAGVGLLLGPLSYGIGQRLGAVEFGLPLLQAVTILGAIWALVLPLALHADRLYLKPAAAMLVLLLPGLAASPDAVAGESLQQKATHLVGEASLSWFFRPIYDARLYAHTKDFRYPPDGDFTFMLEYKLDLKQQQIVKETLRQWEQQQVAVQPEWVQQLQRLIPDVRAGDRLSLQVDADQGARLLHNDQMLGQIDDTAFVEAFTGIWLADTTTRPDLRQQLLGLP
jgi:hypothetical protein